MPTIPFAIWFFLAIEGVANVAEETINPQRNVLIGFGSAIATLVLLCIITFITSIGIAGWEAVVYPSAGMEASDKPLPLAMAKILDPESRLYQSFTFIGLFGLIASFHGIILAAGRSTFEFGRVGFAPAALGRVHSKFRTPAWALIFNMVVGIVALLTGKTGEIITIACFGALTMYIIAMVSLFVLRRNEPELPRPYKVPLFPILPGIALLISSVALIALTIYNFDLAIIYVAMLGLAGTWFYFSKYRYQKGIK